MGKITVCVFVIVCFLFAAVCPVAFAGDAMDDLEGMSNTGTTFDGSDGQRSGMDINFYDAGPSDVPEPTPEPVDTDN